MPLFSNMGSVAQRMGGLALTTSIALFMLVGCGGAPSKSKAGATNEATTEGEVAGEEATQTEDPFYGVYWGFRATTELYMGAFTLLESNELLDAVVPSGDLTGVDCESAVVKKLQKERPVACVPFERSGENDETITVHYANGRKNVWIRQEDGSLKPSVSLDTDIWTFRRAHKPTFTRLDGSFGRFSGSSTLDGAGGTTSTSTGAGLEIHADGTFSGTIFAGVLQTTAGASTASSKKVSGTYEIDGWEMRVKLTTGEKAALRFVAMTKERGDEEPRYVYVDGFGYLMRRD